MKAIHPEILYQVDKFGRMKRIGLHPEKMGGARTVTGAETGDRPIGYFPHSFSHGAFQRNRSSDRYDRFQFGLLP